MSADGEPGSEDMSSRYPMRARSAIIAAACLASVVPQYLELFQTASQEGRAHP